METKPIEDPFQEFAERVAEKGSRIGRLHTDCWRLRRGPQDVRRDIQVPLAPSVSRRLIPFAAQPGPYVGPFHWKNRRLRVPELKRLQGFPGAFEFSGSRRSIQVQVGNSVPPPLACVVADSLKRQLADEPRGQLQLFSAAQIVG
jgi:site-specific DNA-cytosine methylase